MHAQKFHQLILVLLLTSLMPTVVGAVEVPIGASYGDVIEALGKPDGELSAGSKKILSYGAAQITLRSNSVTAVSPDLERLLAERTEQKKAGKPKRAPNLVSFREQWITPEKKRQILQAENSRRSAINTNQPGTWLTDFNKAAALAKSQNKQMLLNFTGSDWCGWCIKLDNEVFSKPEFMNYAREHYILVTVDFPKGKEQSTALKQQNKALAQKYRVQGFPSIIILEPAGKLRTTRGYVQGGPEAFLKAIR